MNQRVLVMNGQRLLQSERDGQWVIAKVDKAGELKPGIYRLDAAHAADTSRSHSGVVVHADKNFVYQQCGPALVRHSAQAFDTLPQIGAGARIDYDQGHAQYHREGAAARRGVRR